LNRAFDKVFIDNEIPLHIGFPTERRFQKLKEKTPQMCGTIPWLAKVIDFDSLTDKYLARGWLRSIVNPPGHLVTTIAFRQVRTVAREDIKVERVDQFTPEFDEFWNQVCDKYPVIAIRDQAYLSWRFAPLSNRSYDILVAWGQGQIQGYVVLRTAPRRGVKTGFIMDLMISEGSMGEYAGECLMAETESLFRAQNTVLIAGLMVPFASEYRVLRRSGFRPIPQLLGSPVFRFMFGLHETRDSDLASLSAQEWYITYADY
jgi:hypothetical protein